MPRASPSLPADPRAAGRTRPDRRTILAASAGLLSGAALACAGPARARDEIDELFSDLTDQSSRWQPISAAEKRPRLARLAGLLAAARCDALLIEPGATLRYLSDVGWGPSERLFALIVLADG